MPKLTTPFWTEEGKLYRPGSDIPASALGAKATADATGGTDAFNVDEATKPQLVAEAERLGLTVTRADGEDGVPLADDYRAAIRAAQDA